MKKYDKLAALFALLILICLFSLPEVSGQRRPIPSEEGASQQDISDSLAQFKSLSLDLPYYFNRNVMHEWGTSVYPLVGNFSAGEHGDSTTGFLTDNQSIGVYVPSGGTDDGIVFPVPDTNWTKTADGDTLIPGDWYFNITVRLDSASQARLPTNGLIFVPGSNGNSFKTNVTRANFSAGWNFVKVLLSAFTTNAGTPSWANIDSLWIYTNGTQSGDGALIFLVDNFQLVRADPDAAEPNPFQTETANGTWTAVFTQEGDGNGWVVEEGGKLSITFPEPATGASYLESAITFGNHEASGMVDKMITDRTKLYSCGGGQILLTLVDQVLMLTGNASSYNSVAFTWPGGGNVPVYWKFVQEGTAISGAASLTGLEGDWTWVSNSTATTSGKVRITGNYYQRIKSLGLSAIKYAGVAGVAQRLQGISFERGAEGLEITIGDSTYFMVIDSVQ